MSMQKEEPLGDDRLTDIDSSAPANSRRIPWNVLLLVIGMVAVSFVVSATMISIVRRLRPQQRER